MVIENNDMTPDLETDLNSELEEQLGIEKETDPEEKDLGKDEDPDVEKELEDEGKEKKEEPAKKEDDDPEIDLGDLGKLKKSELKDFLDKGKDYTKKTQELSEKEKSVKELQNWAGVVKGDKEAIEVLIKFSEKLVNDKGEYNKDMLRNMRNVLDGKIEEKREELAENKIELEKELDELDPDSPSYKILKASLDNIKRLEKRLDEKDQENAKAIKADEEKAYQEQVKHAQQVYKNTLDELIDPEKEGSLKFENPDGKQIWQSLVASYLKDNPKDYKDEADFISTLKEVGKVMHSSISKYSEKIIADYLEKKKPAVKKEKSPIGKKDTQLPDLGNRESLEAAVAAALNEEMAT